MTASMVHTGGTNAFIWASWAFLEAKLGNATRARQLYDASTVADPKHAAAWHGWGLLEKKQGNLLRARDLWLKVKPALRRCNPSSISHMIKAVIVSEMLLEWTGSLS